MLEEEIKTVLTERIKIVDETQDEWDYGENQAASGESYRRRRTSF